MKRGSFRWQLSAQLAVRGRAKAASTMRFSRLFIESLEDRRLLTAISGTASFNNLAVDSGQSRTSSLIVQFKSGASSPGSLAAYVTTAGIAPEWALTPGMRKVDLDPTADLAAALLAFKQDPNVLFAQPDYQVSLQMAPNDPDFGQLWGLDNSGQTGGTEDADIDAPEAWDVTTGSQSTIVAVIDTGVDYTHPDLAANIWTNPGEIPGNGIDDDKNGYVDDVHGYDFVNHDGDPMDDHFHGTHVAGTIGAVGGDENGIAGVNWHVQIMALKFLDATGGGYESDAISALNYAVANGAVVSNNSWGGGGFSPAFQTAIQNAAAKGHIFVAAAGNDGWNNDLDPFYPASYNVDNVISVAATDANDQLAWFSNYGTKSVDLAAPGVNIYSTFPTHVTQAMRDDGFGPDYGIISGTSMATPHVTGVVALVRSLHPDWSYTQVIDQVLGSVDIVDGALKTITGGRLNAAAAVGNVPPDTVGPRVISTDPSNSVTGTLDHVRLRFNESIDPATIGVDDVVGLTGPDGPITVLSVAAVAGNSRQFDVKFAPQTALGSYSLVIGPIISDLSGNLLDQNRDGIGGEDPEDLFTATIEITDVVGFDSPDVPAEIDNLNSLFGLYTASTLTIGQNITIGDINVQLNISYPYDSDLKIYLESPSGTQVALSTYNGGDSPDFVDTIFDDEATVPISSGFAPYFGAYRPDEPLSAFDGQNAAGVWTLWVAPEFKIEHFLDGVGWLNTWSLQVAGGGNGSPPPPPPPPPPGNRPPVAGSDSLQGELNTRLSVSPADLLANDSDPDGDPLSITFVGNPTHGSVSLDQNQLITFTPDPDYTGPATFQYIVSDGFLTATGDVSIDFEPRFQWHNSILGADVNGDGVVAPGDAIIIINLLNSIGSQALVSLSADSPVSMYLDVSPDNYVAPSDALGVINYINTHPASPMAPSTTQTASQADAVDRALMDLLLDSGKPSRGSHLA